MAETPSPQKVIDTYKNVTFFYAGLEALAAKYQAADKSRAAMAAVGLTIRFLQRLNVDRSLIAALIEAQLIIERSVDGGVTEKKQQMGKDVADCVAFFHQRRCNVKPADAFRAIVGSDPAAKTHLENFYKKTMSGQKPEARVLFDEMNKLFEGMPPEVAMKRSLRSVLNLRGKKVQKAR